MAKRKRKPYKKGKALDASIVIICLLLALTIKVFSLKQPLGYSGAQQNVFSGGVTNASTTVATSSATLILSRNVNRQYAVICNDDSTNPVYLHFSATDTAVVIQEGYKLTAGSCYEMDSDNLYVGKVYGIASGGQVKVTTLEK